MKFFPAVPGAETVSDPIAMTLLLQVRPSPGHLRTAQVSLRRWLAVLKDGTNQVHDGLNAATSKRCREFIDQASRHGGVEEIGSADLNSRGTADDIVQHIVDRRNATNADDWN